MLTWLIPSPSCDLLPARQRVDDDLLPMHGSPTPLPATPHQPLSTTPPPTSQRGHSPFPSLNLVERRWRGSSKGGTKKSTIGCSHRFTLYRYCNRSMWNTVWRKKGLFAHQWKREAVRCSIKWLLHSPHLTDHIYYFESHNSTIWNTTMKDIKHQIQR